MNKVIGKLFFATIAAVSFSACSSDLTEEHKQDNTQGQAKGYIAFVADQSNIPEVANNAPETRTGGEYSSNPSIFKGMIYYWNKGDHMWIDKKNDGTYEKSDSSSIGNSPKLADATFFFKGDFNEASYKMRYTGNNSTSADEVTFAEEQIQDAPGDAGRLGEYGDCGVADATKGTDVKYKFTLKHKAAYLVLTPYSDYAFSSTVGIAAVYVTADKPISGKFAFTDSGVGAPKAGAKNTIAWFYQEPLAGREYISTMYTMNRTNFLPIPQIANAKQNGIIIVLPPGTYNELTIEYGLIDYATGGYGYYKQTFKNNKELKAGENRVLKCNIKLNEEYDPNQYYAWDADIDAYYWKGKSAYMASRISAPMISSGYATTAADPRFQNETPGGSTTSVADNAANRSAAAAMNINEALWLVNKGAAKWDEWKMFVMNKHLYNGGIWIKTLQQIAGEMGKSLNDLKEAYNGLDYRTKVIPSSISRKNFDETASNYVRPAKAVRGQYMFLPAVGYFGRPKAQPNFRVLLFCGDQGFYWTSSAGTVHKNGGMAFCFERTDLNPAAFDDELRYDYAEPSYSVSVTNFDKFSGAPYLVNLNNTGKFRIK